MVLELKDKDIINKRKHETFAYQYKSAFRQTDGPSKLYTGSSLFYYTKIISLSQIAAEKIIFLISLRTDRRTDRQNKKINKGGTVCARVF